MTETIALDANFAQDAHRMYARLRAEAPVHPVLFEEGARACLVTRYDDALALLNNPRLIKDAQRAQTQFALDRPPAVSRFGFQEHVDAGPWP